MRTHLLFGGNVLHAIFKLQYTIDKSNLFLKFLLYSEYLRKYRERRDQTIASWKILNQTVIVKTKKVVAVVYWMWMCSFTGDSNYKRFDWIIFGVLNK